MLAAQLEQHKGRLAVAIAARDRADADCTAAKAERAAAERDREAAEKVLAEVVTQLDDMERQQDATQPMHLPASAAGYALELQEEPDDLEPAAADDGEQLPSPAAQRLSRDPRLAAGGSGGLEDLPPGGAAAAQLPSGEGGMAAADDHMPVLADSPVEGAAVGMALTELVHEPSVPELKQTPLSDRTYAHLPSLASSRILERFSAALLEFSDLVGRFEVSWRDLMIA